MWIYAPFVLNTGQQDQNRIQDQGEQYQVHFSGCFSVSETVSKTVKNGAILPLDG
jgi:hypothetical protein